MYLQDKASAPPSEEPSGDIEEATNPDDSTHLTMVHKSLSYGTEAASDMRILQKTGRKLTVVGIGNHELTGLDVVTAPCSFQSSSGKVVGFFPEHDYLEIFKTQVDNKTIKVGEQAAEDRGKGTGLVTLKKRVPVVHFMFNYVVDKSTCLTTQEHLQHAWDITLQHPGQLGYHDKTVVKHKPSMLWIQVACSFTATFYPGPKVPGILDHIFVEFLFLCLIDAHGKTPLLGFHQVPLDLGQIGLLQTFCEDDSYDYPLTPDPSKQGQNGPDIDNCELHVLTGHKVPQHKGNNVTSVLQFSKPYFVCLIQQSVAATTTYSVTRSSYCMCQVFHWNSNLVTTPSSCILLTLA